MDHLKGFFVYSHKIQSDTGNYNTCSIPLCPSTATLVKGHPAALLPYYHHPWQQVWLLWQICTELYFPLYWGCVKWTITCMRPSLEKINHSLKIIKCDKETGTVTQQKFLKTSTNSFFITNLLFRPFDQNL